MSFQPDVFVGSSHNLDAELAQRLTAWVDSTPGFPHTVERIMAMSRDMGASPHDLARLIEEDPVVMVKLLKVVNSTHYGGGRGITNVNRAVVFLGFNTIKNLATGIADSGSLPHLSEGGFDAARYLVHSLSTAAIARRLAAQRPGQDPMEYYVAGLLHDFGKLMLARYKPSKFRRALDASLWEGSPLRTNLQTTTGHHHEQICAWLLASWGFPRWLVSAISTQYLPDQDPMAACVHVANLISKALLAGTPAADIAGELPSSVQALLGGTLAQVVGSIDDLDGIMRWAASH